MTSSRARLLFEAMSILALLGLAGSAHAEHTCSVSTLEGTFMPSAYGHASGNPVPNVGARHSHVISAVFHGVGIQTLYRAKSIVRTDFRPDQTGTYRAKPACTRVVRIKYDSGGAVLAARISSADGNKTIEDFQARETVPSFRFCRNNPDWYGTCNAADNVIDKITLESICSAHSQTLAFPSRWDSDGHPLDHHLHLEPVAH